MSAVPTAGLPAAVLVGMSTGPRSFTALAAAVDTIPGDATTNPERALSHPAVKGVITLMAAQEWVMDKLPQTPSRLEILGVCARAVGAAGAGALLARRAATRQAEVALPGDPVALAPGAPEAGTEPTGNAIDDVRVPVTGAVVAAAVAIATAYVGPHIRTWFDSRVGRDWPGAILEDVSSLGLALAAVRAS